MQTRFFNSKKHIHNLINSDYYKNLIKLRNIIEIGCDNYFQSINATKVDLFMITKGASSPMGRGSDSLPISFKFGTQNVFLVDSAQFGMEPLVQKSFDMVYCYLPSFRDEDAGPRHLNQFYHCEAEMRGNYKKSMSIAENLVRHLIKNIIKAHKEKLINFKQNNFTGINKILGKRFPIVTFDEVEELFKKRGLSHLIEKRSYGRVLTNKAEIKVGEIIGKNIIPVWITNYDRDTVAFYQKPDKSDTNRVLNADLIFPSVNKGFGGEIIGLGERQNSVRQLKESMERQEIKNMGAYKWYTDLRKTSNYVTTSGFGLGVERFIAWVLRLDSIIDAAIYPMVKNQKSML